MSAEIKIRAELFELYTIAIQVYDAISADLTGHFNKELTLFESKNKICSKNIEDFETGIYNLNRCVALYRAQRNLYYYYSQAKELQGDFLDNLMFGLKINKSLDMNNEDSNFESVKLNLIKSIIVAIRALNKILRTEAMLEFASTNVESVGKTISENQYHPKLNFCIKDSPASAGDISTFLDMESSSRLQYQQNSDSHFFKNKSKNLIDLKKPLLYSESNPELPTLMSLTSNLTLASPISDDYVQATSSKSQINEFSRERSAKKVFFSSPQIPTNTYVTQVEIPTYSIVNEGIISYGGNITVKKRYTEFVKLRNILCYRYSIFKKTIPTLPPKRVIGNFDEKFLQVRKRELQDFITYVSLHQILGSSVYLKNWYT
ncbi:hypothetical protein BB561_001811 [Smittium simulii]|uniref:Sorting nexin MVP1 n=1 Tax=Smittium simulii TaxID=133385 RepID=A0A2T9YSX9_9FUNG|nr:hypothetical protein BB561_001811 [Smittium simulii]